MSRSNARALTRATAAWSGAGVVDLRIAGRQLGGVRGSSSSRRPGAGLATSAILMDFELSATPQRWIWPRGLETQMQPND